MAKKQGFTRKQYNKRYYELNREEINRRRRRKYKLDRDYKERCKKTSRESYRRRSKRDGIVDRTMVKVGDNYYYTSGHFRYLIGREPSTIRTLQRNGLIPEVSTVTEAGWRLYSENQKDLVVAMFQAYDAGDINNLREFTPYLEKHWKD